MTDVTCPHCGRIHEIHGAVTPGATPTPGDVSICWGCTRVAIYTDDGLRKPTTAEQKAFDAAPDVTAARAAVARQITPSAAIREARNHA